MSTTKSIVISCAGIGSRLGLGQSKALLNINGRSIISRQLELFSEIEDVRVVVGYQASEVVKEVLKFRPDAVFIFNHDYFSSKTGTSFYLGARHANELVIEWDGDLLVHPDDVRKILGYNREFIAYTDISSDEAVFINIDNDGKVIEFSRDFGAYEWTGPACINRNRLSCANGNVYDQLTDLLPIEGVKIRAFDIDTYDDYIRVCELVKNW